MSSLSSSTNFTSTSTSRSSHDSTTLHIDPLSTCAGHSKPMHIDHEAECCNAEKLNDLEFADQTFQAAAGNCVLNCEDIEKRFKPCQ